MIIDPESWPILSKLLDEWLELPADSRQGWLEGLSPEYDRVLPALRSLVDKHSGALADDFLGSLPKFGRSAPPTLETSPDLASDHEPGSMVGPWRLVRELGRGGMGVVWMAEGGDGGLQRRVALKLPVVSTLDRVRAERFARERDILARLAHPQIGRLYDAGVTPSGQPYLVLEYIEGVSITQYSDDHQLSIKARLTLFLQVLGAVQYAHANLVVHRDLKPSNILVTSGGDVRLLDFGVAKLLRAGEARETELTRISGRALTPNYASPEQITGDTVTTATDVYALGVLLCELLTGERPYKLAFETPAALEAAILTDDPVRPSQAVRDEGQARARALSLRKLKSALRGDLDTIVVKALRKQPQERYATPEAFAADIERHLNGAAVLARPESTWYRAGKFIRRNRIVVGATGVVIMALTLGLFVALREARRAQVQAKKAEAVQAFLTDIFFANSVENANPLKAGQTTARELLDIGAKKLDSALNDAPEAKLDVQQTLADLYQDLGLKDQAVAIRRKRIQLAKAIYGPSSHAVGEALVELANSLGQSSSVNDLPAVIREAEETLDRNHDYTSLYRAFLYNAKSRLYSDTDLGKSVEEGRKAVGLLRNLPDRDGLIAALSGLGQCLIKHNDYREAISVLSEAAGKAADRGAEGRAKGRLPAIYAFLGESEQRVLDLAQAERTFRLAVETGRSIDGEEHETTVQTRQRLGGFLCETDRPQEGLTLIRAALDLALKIKGPSDPFHTAGVMMTYGHWLVVYGRVEEGLRWLVQSNDIRRRANRTGTRLYRQTAEYQSAAETELGHYQRAQVLLDESGLGQAAALTRARLQMATGRTEAAGRSLAELPPSPQNGEGLSVTWLETSLGRAEVDVALGHRGEALDLAHGTRARIEASPLRQYFKRYEARALVSEGQALVANGRAADALPLLDRAVSLRDEVFDREMSPDLAAAQIALAECLTRLGRGGPASRMLASAKAIHSRHRELGPHLRRPLRDLEAEMRGIRVTAAETPSVVSRPEIGACKTFAECRATGDGIGEWVTRQSELGRD